MKTRCSRQNDQNEEVSQTALMKRSKNVQINETNSTAPDQTIKMHTERDKLFEIKLSTLLTESDKSNVKYVGLKAPGQPMKN